MDLKECLTNLGSSYEDAMGRLLSEDRVKKFLRMFSYDLSYNELCTAMENGDYDTAFRAAHTLKGVCANLGIEKLRMVSSDMTEALRAKDIIRAGEMLPAVKCEYDNAIACIDSLE